MIDKKELLEKYYSEHPEWEQRRYEVLKSLAAANYCASAITGALHNKKPNYAGHLGDFELLKRDADKTLATLNPEIADSLSPFKFNVGFKKTPEVLKGKTYQFVEVLSYQNPPKIEEIIQLYNLKDSSLRWDASSFSLDDFKIEEIK